MGEDAGRSLDPRGADPLQSGGGDARLSRLPYLATYALAWTVVTAPVTYAALVLSARECAPRAGYGLAAAAAALAVLLLGARTLLGSARWPPVLVAWLALALPPAVGLLIGFGCNVLWW